MNKKILFFVTEDWYFCSHRLPLAKAAKHAGYDVAVVTRVREHGERIESCGIRLIPLELSRRGKNPWKEWRSFRTLCAIYWREKPDLVHHVALKPILYGTLAALLCGIPRVVNALAGLGYLFASADRRAALMRPFAKLAFRALLSRRGGRVILQNPDDYRLLVTAASLRPDTAVLIKGSGVDLEQFRARPESGRVPLVLLASRMLWDKGVGEFVTAAQRLGEEGINARFVLVGDGDEENPAVVPAAQLESWNRSGSIEWWGKRENMPEILAGAHIVCLPSYREGLPKVLLEAAAAGKPIVTTDTPGCREVVRHGENGLLVPPRDAEALARALKTLIADEKLRERMGRRGREIAEAEFGIEKVVTETLAVYRSLLA